MNARSKIVVWTGCGFGLLGLGAGLLLFFCDPAKVPIYPVCVFHAVTGLQCPGCGSLRALHQLLHGDIRAALQFNAMLVVSLPFVTVLAIRVVRRQSRQQPGLGVRSEWLWLFLVAWIIFGVLRNLPLPLVTASAP